jgi:hypothetical protein
MMWCDEIYLCVCAFAAVDFAKSDIPQIKIV